MQRRENMQNRKPMILVFAGPNGSGKSTITGYFDIIGKYTNADEIALSSGISNEEAAVLSDKSRYESIKRKEDFTFETVLSSHYKLDLLKEAKAAGFFIKCIFVLTKDPLINIQRVEARVALGGHNVDSETVKKRYYKSIDNLKELVKICDILHVYDNTVAPQRVIRKHKEEITFFPNGFWTERELVQLINFME